MQVLIIDKKKNHHPLYNSNFSFNIPSIPALNPLSAVIHQPHADHALSAKKSRTIQCLWNKLLQMKQNHSQNHLH